MCFADKLGDGEWGKHHSAYHDTPGNEKTSSHPAIDDYNKKMTLKYRVPHCGN